MANYRVILRVEERLPASVEKKLREVFGPKLKDMATIEKLTTPESRSARLEEAAGFIEQGKDIVIELKEEMEAWFDSIPDNLKDGDKAGEVNDAKEALESLEGELEQLSFDIDFPGMF